MVFNHSHTHCRGAAEASKHLQRLVEFFPCSGEEGSTNLVVNVLIGSTHGYVQLAGFMAEFTKLHGQSAVGHQKRG